MIPLDVVAYQATVQQAMVALTAVDRWLTRHTREDESDSTVYFEGLPRPEIGQIREKVRAALNCVSGTAPIPPDFRLGDAARVFEVAPTNLEWFATFLEQGVNISQGYGAIHKSIFPMVLRSVAAAVRSLNDEARKVQIEIDTTGKIPTPGGIVMVWSDEMDQPIVHAFERYADAETFADADVPEDESRTLIGVGEWKWHAAVAGQLTAESASS